MTELIDIHRRFCRHCAIEENLSPLTVKSMRSFFGTFLKRTNAIRSDDVTEDLLREFFWEGREKYQWSYWHYVNHYKYFKKFFNWCINRGSMEANPVLGISLPKKPQTLPRRLAHEEAQSVLYASFNCDWEYHFQRTRNHAIVAVFLYAGLRCKELLDLELLDVNLESGTILVRCGKGAKDRYVPMHHKLRYVLKRYLDDRKRLGKKSFYLFTGIRSDKPLNYKDVCRLCRRVSGEAGIKFTPHQLRHTFASVSIEQGIGIVQVKEILGHSNISSTMIYLKISPKGLKESLNKIDLF